MRNLLTIAVGSLVVSFAANTLGAETYRIGTGDVLELRVLEWDPLDSQANEWGALRGELPVGTDGMVNVPFVGTIMAQSLTPAELGQQVAQQLQQRLGTAMPLDAVITVADYRPVYISGAVRSPGEYRYRPGLGVVQLLAQAGGSLLDQTAQNVDARDILNREGAMSLLEREGERLSARRAMLRAAIAGQAELAPQDALSSILMDTENDVLQLRRQQRARELTALNDQISLLANEVTALTARAEAVDRLREIAQEEYESALALVQRGLAASGRIGEAERAIAQAEAQQLDISTAILRARQGITIAEAEKLALRDREMIEDTRQLQVVDERLDQIMANLETQQRIALAETGMFVQQRLGDEDTALPKPIVTIRRTTAQGIETLSGLDVILAPGDVVEVTMPRLANRWNQALPAAMTQ